MAEARSIGVAVIGGGAAGLMAAISAAKMGAEVTLFEKNDRFGKKLAITGKGRCNVTNDCTVEEFLASVPTNPRFLYSALGRFNTADTKEFFENAGVPLKVQDASSAEINTLITQGWLRSTWSALLPTITHEDCSAKAFITSL